MVPVQLPTITGPVQLQKHEPFPPHWQASGEECFGEKSCFSHSYQHRASPVAWATCTGAALGSSHPIGPMGCGHPAMSLLVLWGSDGTPASFSCWNSRRKQEINKFYWFCLWFFHRNMPAPVRKYLYCTCRGTGHWLIRCHITATLSWLNYTTNLPVV